MSEPYSLSKTRSSGVGNYDVSKSLASKLVKYAQTTQKSNLKVGFGVVGVFPFLATVVGIAIVFIASVVAAAQSGNVKENAEPYFVATIVGLSFASIGIVLSLIKLAEVISFIKFAATEDPRSPFIFRTPIEEAEFQAQLKETRTRAELASKVPGFGESRRLALGADRGYGVTLPQRPTFDGTKSSVTFVDSFGAPAKIYLPKDIKPCTDNKTPANTILEYLSQVQRINPNFQIDRDLGNPGSDKGSAKYRAFLNSYRDLFIQSCEGIQQELQNNAKFVADVIQFASADDLAGGRMMKFVKGTRVS